MQTTKASKLKFREPRCPNRNRHPQNIRVDKLKSAHPEHHGVKIEIGALRTLGCQNCNGSAENERKEDASTRKLTEDDQEKRAKMKGRWTGLNKCCFNEYLFTDYRAQFIF